MHTNLARSENSSLPIYRLSTEFAESFACHSIDKFGFFTIATKDKKRARPWEERSRRLEQMPAILGPVAGDPDTYISQASFASPNRRIVNLARVGLLWVDLDTYDIEALKNVPVSHLVQRLLWACEERNIPPPSVIIDSGMGMYAKWYLDAPLPARALPRWQLIQNTFCARLADFGADKKARDASRVLRIIGTIHADTKRPVEVLWENTLQAHGAALVNGIAAYNFDMLADEILPLTREKLNELRAQRDKENLARETRLTATGHSLTLVKGTNTSGLRPFIPSQLAWDRFNDIAKLATLRGWDQGAPAGQRDMPVFLSAALMAQALVVPQLNAEIAAIAQKFAPSWSSAEINSCVTSVLSRARAAAAGEKIEYQGRQVDPRYLFRNTTLLALLDITPAEETQLSTIISKEEARRRDAARARARRQAEGATSRERYEADAAIRGEKAVALRGVGKSWGEVGEMLGVTATAARLLARRTQEKRSCASVYM
jgi:hypothetical protein